VIESNDDINEVEVVTTAVGDDGTVVVDDLKALVDHEGNVLATDETIAVETPDGTIVVDEVISVTGDDGELHAVEEDVAVIEGDDA
jgi:hypothetical protein